MMIFLTCFLTQNMGIKQKGKNVLPVFFNDTLIKLKFYRSECHSQTIKALKANGLVDVNEKDIRLDFIFTNSTGIQDMFFCEDKPTIKISNKDKHKADYLRESAVDLVSFLTKNAPSIYALCHAISTS